MRRIGIDVGGTNTDAVLIEGNRVAAAVKSPTTEDVTSGVVASLAALLGKLDGGPGAAADIEAVMIGTTHFTNAVVQRRDLIQVAAIRIGLPVPAALPQMIDWPDELRETVRPMCFSIAGGHEYDGRPLAPLDEAALREAGARIRAAGITSIGVTATFSPLTAECEIRAGEILRAACPDADITLSHSLGRIGLLERENVTLLNACLASMGRTTVAAFAQALRDAGITAPFYLTQNDGTVMLAEQAARYPVYSFASGPTNSMRGAAFLTGLSDALVVDVGGTTSDIGCLVGGFPREANNVVEIGGVRTLFRMPDLLSLGLGGGSVIAPDPLAVGPRSVGYRLTREALAFGGTVLTATDIALAAGLCALDGARKPVLDAKLLTGVLDRMRDMLEDGIDRMKVQAGDAPLIAVGGGAFLIPDTLAGVSQVVRVPHAGVANAVGAAIAQVSGEVDQVFSGMTRSQALAEAQKLAEDRAVTSGADGASLKTVEIEDLPIAYLPGDSRRVRVRVVGDIRAVRA